MFSYRFPAVKGMQAGTEYYICMIPLGLLGKIFSSDHNDVGPEYRAQRRLNEARIPEIRDYILNNRESYVFSALAASVDGEMNFVSGTDSNVGVLEISLDSTFLINDGQHRKAAIQAALMEDESLSHETISVVLFRDRGLQKSQQMFTDLNKHAVITSKSLNTLYESKDEIAIIAKRVVDDIPFFRKYTDKEKDNLGKFSSNIFTLNIFHNANKRILSNSKKTMEDNYAFVHLFWLTVVQNMREWNEMDHGELSKKDLRENYIVTQGVTLLALGRLGKFYFENPEVDMVESLKKLRSIDWLRNNSVNWLGRAVKQNGKINRNERGIFLTYIQIKRLLGLLITEEELQKEQF